jgi:hypothetical protein
MILMNGRRYSSRAMVMAPLGQMKAQIPQPLQKS